MPITIIEGENMKVVRIIMLVLVLAVVLGKVAMLPPEIFKEPIFAAQDSSGDDGGSRDGGYTEFA